jgi:hypothetical protein
MQIITGPGGVVLGYGKGLAAGEGEHVHDAPPDFDTSWVGRKSISMIGEELVVEDVPRPPQPPVVNETRSMHAAWIKAALADMGKLAAVDAAVKAAGPVQVALWTNVTSISIADASVNVIAAALNIDLEVLFDRAEALRLAHSQP